MASSNGATGVFLGFVLGAVVFLAPVAGVRRNWTEGLSEWSELALCATFILSGGLIVGRWLQHRSAEQFKSARSYTAPEIDATPGSTTQEVDLASVDSIEATEKEQAETTRSKDSDTKESHTDGAVVEDVQPSGDEEKLSGTAATAVLVHGKPREQTKAEKRIRLIISPDRVARTSGLAFLMLYVNCAVLCQRLGFGMFSVSADVAFILQVLGVALASVGAIYIAISDRLSQKERVLHPNYFGVFVILTGAPLVFSTWFPLLALPGILVGMLWSIGRTDKGKMEQASNSGLRTLIPFLY